MVEGTDFVRAEVERVAVWAAVEAEGLAGGRPRLLGAGSSSSGSATEVNSGTASGSASAGCAVVRLRLVCVPVAFLSWRLLRAR